MAKGDVLVRFKADVSGYDANIAKARRQLDQFKKDNLSMGGVMKQVSGSMVSVAAQYASVAAAIGAVGMALRDNIQTARNFEKSMSQLSSLTGKTGEDLVKLKEYAIELGGSTTLTASQVADAFRLIGSQQPQLLESSEALKAVTKQAIMLSEAAGIDLQTAAQTLSTSINQMGGDSNNAARYVNVLAAASQKGAGDIAWLGEAITKSATAAKAVGTDYEELVGNLEQLAKAGFDASTAGTALRSIIMNLEKQANDEFKPSIVGLTQAFENLGKANLSIVEYQQIAGKMFASQAMALANASGEARKMTQAITGTNIAEEQAKTNTDNLDGSLKQLASAWEALNLHINSSNGYMRVAVDWLKDIVTWADKALVGLGEVKGNRDKLNNEGAGEGNTRVDRQIGTLGRVSIGKRQAVYSQQVQNYWRYINEWEKKLSEAEHRKDIFAWETIKKNNDIATANDNIAGAKSMLKEYQERAKKLLVAPAATTGTTGGGKADIDLSVDVDADGSGMKSIKDLQSEIKRLKKLRDDAANAGNTKLRDQYNAQIKSVQQQIKLMRGGTTTTTHHTIQKEQTDLQKNQEKINKLTEEYIKLGDDITEQGETRKNTIRVIIAELERMNQQMRLYQENASGKLLGGNVQTTGLAPHGVTAVNVKGLTTQTKPLEHLSTIGKDVTAEWTKAAQALTQVGSAIAQIEDPAAKVLGIVAQAVATVALTFAQSLKGTVTPWDWIAAAASGTATMISTIAAIQGATSGYAQGGVITGNSYSGDNLLAQGPNGEMIGLNAGEVVLNKAQTAALASSLQGGGGDGGRRYQPSYISGEQIFIALNRYTRRSGKGEIVLWK